MNLGDLKAVVYLPKYEHIMCKSIRDHLRIKYLIAVGFDKKSAKEIINKLFI